MRVLIKDIEDLQIRQQIKELAPEWTLLLDDENFDYRATLNTKGENGFILDMRGEKESQVALFDTDGQGMMMVESLDKVQFVLGECPLCEREIHGKYGETKALCDDCAAKNNIPSQPAPAPAPVSIPLENVDTNENGLSPQEGEFPADIMAAAAESAAAAALAAVEEEGVPVGSFSSHPVTIPPVTVEGHGGSDQEAHKDKNGPPSIETITGHPEVESAPVEAASPAILPEGDNTPTAAALPSAEVGASGVAEKSVAQATTDNKLTAAGEPEARSGDGVTPAKAVTQEAEAPETPAVAGPTQAGSKSGGHTETEIVHSDSHPVKPTSRTKEKTKAVSAAQPTEPPTSGTTTATPGPAFSNDDHALRFNRLLEVSGSSAGDDLYASLYVLASLDRGVEDHVGPGLVNFKALFDIAENWPNRDWSMLQLAAHMFNSGAWRLEINELFTHLGREHQAVVFEALKIRYEYY